ncbi:MAG: electron transfer flavoprotein subunit beta/FixA family protein [Elusimicrobia bacterium]|jgi:electron transfer flavoprotein alpha/beta subunit|nr:electron transfer flavoprotein subunit beta/FixA family protein [Elusimicrobiota bacterium]MBK7208229.1 electron transfer flavoprotein subunit beta/FixA family protein [Elusimicrobiota bacterium]MBK7544993.1 electron transfer flavoprotein subunit beta/FixA family protein [Elusimicrobiota bacterium]MBK7574509.1 electron transfer flavoprotein subunit beta/FixA family protein [Elusimicrobiota bacterium]MBK7688126.1 electron transfer flavoprotein subunit beta/FixA family protein [Elusimicrobiota
MGLHIVVCIKQTPATSNIQIDPVTGTLKREGMAAAINPFDEYAIEEAVRIKERVPGTTVSVVTMGPPQAEESLRESIARGADQAFHLTSRAFAGADTWATSYTLQMGIRKIAKEKGPVHLVLCGKQTNDGDTGHVGPGIAAWLDWPNIAYVKKVEAIDEKKIVVHRMMEDGVDVLEMDLPAVIAVVKEINEPRVASLKGKMAAKKAVVPKWTEVDIEADKKSIGLGGSPTIVSKSFNPPPRKGGAKIDGPTPEAKAKALIDKLQEMKLI